MDISDFIGAAKTFHVLGIKVTKDGDLINEWYSEPECRRNIYSATKSFTSCAVGFAVQEGLLSLDEKLTDAFPEDLPDVIDDNLKMATVRDLLTMCLGQEQGSLMGEQRPLYQEDDWVKMSLAIPFQYKPGTHFVYNNVGPYLAGILVQRRSGCDLVSYLTPRLFKHLGIKRPTWETDPLGNSFGAGGLFLTLSELHKFGLFYLNKGKWNGKQIIPESWAEASVTKKVDSIEGTYGYGYQLWMEERPGSFEYNGMLGQNVLIYPDVDMVIVTNAGNEELFQDNVMLNIIRKYFPVDWMPKETLPENPIAYAKLQELTERLAGKRLKNDQYYNSALIIRKGGWKKNSSKYRVRERQTEIEKAQNQQIHLLTDLLDGTCYEMEQASVGLFPLVMQVMHNNMTDGISKINFYKKRTKELQQTLILCFQEGEESIELEMGWNQYIENKLSIHGETYLVAVKGELSSDVDDNPVLKVEIVYLEEAMRRKLYVTFVKDTSASKLITPEYIEIKWYESPGKALIMEGMESITTEVTKHPIYSRIRENGGIDLLHRLMGQTIEPVIKGRIIDSSEEAQQDTEVQHPEISVD